MATNPTINSQTLSTGGTHSRFGQPQVRITESQIPSVRGAFSQRFDFGPQLITGEGSISAASFAAIKAAVRTIQMAANNTPSDYIDVDGVTHENCILLGYEQVGKVKRESATSFWVQVVWAIRKQVPE